MEVFSNLYHIKLISLSLSLWTTSLTLAVSVMCLTWVLHLTSVLPHQLYHGCTLACDSNQGWDKNYHRTQGTYCNPLSLLATTSLQTDLTPSSVIEQPKRLRGWNTFLHQHDMNVTSTYPKCFRMQLGLSMSPSARIFIPVSPNGFLLTLCR